MKKLLLVILLFAGLMAAWAETEIVDVKTEKKEKFRFNNRMIEYAILAEAGVANNLVVMKDIFQDTLVVDLTGLEDEFKLTMDAFVSPFTFNFNWKDQWGFSLFVNTEASGNMGLSRNILNLSMANNEKIGFGAAVFSEAGGSVFFHIKKFKIKVRPAVFVPVFYTKPDISYTYLNEPNATKMDLVYDMRVYTAKPMEEGRSFQITATPGVDLGLGAEYPLFSFLDLGADLTHIPIMPAAMKDYMEIKGSVNLKMGNEILNNFDFDNIFSSDNSDTVYGTGSLRVLRPFKMLAWADYRPFNTRLFSVIGSLGFSINQLYDRIGAVEGSLKIRSDMANIVIITLGSAYEDRLWKNGVDLALNARAVEFDLGVDMRSQSFIKSWTAAGMGAKFGLKMGW